VTFVTLGALALRRFRPSVGRNDYRITINRLVERLGSRRCVSDPDFLLLLGRVWTCLGAKLVGQIAQAHGKRSWRRLTAADTPRYAARAIITFQIWGRYETNIKRRASIHAFTTLLASADGLLAPCTGTQSDAPREDTSEVASVCKPAGEGDSR